MPTYQYVCTNPDGKHDFELVQSFTDEPASECPTCGSSVRKVYGSVGVVFKGSGFYRTDSRAAARAATAASPRSARATPGAAPPSASSRAGPTCTGAAAA